MSDADSMLYALIKDTTSVSFAVPEDPPGPPVLLNVVTSTPRMLGVGVGLGAGLMQGMRRSGSNLYSVASVAGWNSSFCFGLVGPGSGSFCIRKGCLVQSHGLRKVRFSREGHDLLGVRAPCCSRAGGRCYRRVCEPLRRREQGSF